MGLTVRLAVYAAFAPAFSYTLKRLAYTGMEEQIIWDTSKPNGQLFRAYEVSRLRAAGFTCQYTFERALHETYDWYASNSGAVRH